MKGMILVALTLCCVFASHQTFAQATASFTLQLSSSNPEVKNGDDEVVVIKVKNISDHDVHYTVMAERSSYHFEVRDEHGNTVKETTYGMRVHGTDPNSGPRAYSGVVGGVLKKGETQEGKIELGKEYDFSIPGVYRVTASRFDPDTHILVTSNEIQFTVLPQ